jgi:hypothetical protein
MIAVRTGRRRASCPLLDETAHSRHHRWDMMTHAGSFDTASTGRATERTPTLGISTESAMHSKDAGKDGDAENKGPRKPELEVLRGGDERTGESALAKEFAQRALAPLISDLRGRHGRLVPRRVADAVGLTQQQLADCLEVSLDAVEKSPPPPGLEELLEPFAMVIGIVRDEFGGDSKRVRSWLHSPRPELEGKTPIDALCVPSGIQRVIQFVLGAWLRNAD